MNIKFITLLSTLLIIASTQLAAEELEIPDSFNFIATDSPEVTTFAKQCITTISDSTVNRLTKAASQKGMVSTNYVPNSGKSYLVSAENKLYCVKLSEHNFPILPTSAFEKTLSFTDMSKEESNRLFADISRQIALHGFATNSL